MGNRPVRSVIIDVFRIIAIACLEGIGAGSIIRQNNGLVGIHSHAVDGHTVRLPIRTGDRGHIGIRLINGIQQVPGEVIGIADIGVGLGVFEVRREAVGGGIADGSGTVGSYERIIDEGVAVSAHLVVIAGFQKACHILDSRVSVNGHAVGAQLLLNKSSTGPVVIRTI